jgi:hypothetical protein
MLAAWRERRVEPLAALIDFGYRCGVGLRQIATALDGTEASSNTVTTRLHDVTVEYKLGDRGVGSAHESWTEVTADLPEHYPLTIRIERGRVKPGNPTIDIDLGTPVFDEFFIVEAAPSDVVRLLIDERARSFLMAQPGLIELRTIGRHLQFATIGWITDPARALELANFVAEIASRVREAYAAVNEVPATETGSPYPPEATSPVDQLEARRKAEFEAIGVVSTMRYDQYKRRGAVVFWVIVVVVLFGIALGWMLST